MHSGGRTSFMSINIETTHWLPAMTLLKWTDETAPGEKKNVPIKLVFHYINSAFLKLGHIIFEPLLFILKQHILSLKSQYYKLQYRHWIISIWALKT